MRYARLDYQLRAEQQADGGARQVSGTASTDTEDSYRERIHPAALERAIPEFMRNPVMLWQHDTSKPIGVWESVQRDGNAIRVSGWIMPEEDADDLADFAWKRIARGVVKSLSIGFNGDPHTCGAKDKDGTFWWGKPDGSGDIELKEVSVVTLPANPDTTDLSVMRTLGFDTSRPWELTTEQCRTWGALSANDIETAIITSLDDSDEPEYWVRELYETYAIVINWRDNTVWRVDYTVTDGQVILGNRTQVTQVWVPVLPPEGQTAAAPAPERARLAIADEYAAWDEVAARKHLREWGGDTTQAYLCGDTLPIADVIDGELRVVWRAVVAAAAAMAGARGGADVPPEDRGAVLAALRGYYDDLGKPWPEGLTAETQRYNDVTWLADEPATYQDIRLEADIRNVLSVKGTLESVRNCMRAMAKAGRALSPALAAEVQATAGAIVQFANELRSSQPHVEAQPSPQALLRQRLLTAHAGKETETETR
jgi:HK97 family phage prohead protease